MKKIRPLHIIIFLLAEAILVLCFAMLGDSLPSNVFWLDLVVSSLCLAMVVSRAVPPMIDLDDPAQREVGTLGITWVTTFYYTLTAVVLMVALQYFEVEFIYQLLIQIILAFGLLMMFLASNRVSDKVVEVHAREQAMVGGLDNVRSAMRRLDRVVSTNGEIPAQIKGRVTDINGQLRYLTPCNNPAAAELEQEMTDKITMLTHQLSDYNVNADAVMSGLAELEHIVGERKATLSR